MQSYQFEETKSSGSEHEGKLRQLIKKYAGVFRAGKFAVGSAIGFLDTEIILILGTYILYGQLSAPQSASASPAFWALNAIAFSVGVTVAFFVNEMLILRDRQGRTARTTLWATIQRLVKFQLIFLTGNVIIIVVQLLLLREFGIAPYIGNIVGAIVSFPASYFFSMHFVWSSNEPERNPKPVPRTSLPEIHREPVPSVDVKRQIMKQFPRFTNENLNIDVHEYKLDISNIDENTFLINFSLNLDVTPKKIESSKEVVTVQ